MIETVFQSPDGKFSWIDVTDPAPETLRELAREYSLHPTSVEDCLEPEHLPKYEKIGGTYFLVVRALDENAPPDADTVRSMTRKTAAFASSGLLLTVHRKPQRFLTELQTNAGREITALESASEALAIALVREALWTFRRPLEEAEKRLEVFETELFLRSGGQADLREVLLMKRRIGVIRWIARHTLEAISRFSVAERDAPLVQDIREDSQWLVATAEALLDDASNLLNTWLGMAAQRTNHVVRILTLFSAFFMPLTFLAGIYGMNFERMPELKWTWGYPAVLAVMAAVALGIYIWFHRNGWLSGKQT